MDLLHTAHVPPGNGPFPTVLALHGWGANAHDLLGLAPSLSDRCQMVCPQGATTLPIGPGVVGYGWFPLIPGQPPDPRAFLKASAQLRRFVAEAESHYSIDRRRFAPLGFSQGGLMAIDLALRDPERFAGLIVLSSWLPEILAANLPRTPAHEGFPVLMVHGTEDQQIEVDRARTSRQTLEDFGVDLAYHEFAMGHEIRPEALRVIRRWVEDELMA